MQIIAHRGASGYAPENTIASFKQAIALGADMIELDVFAIKSGEIVVHHDDTVDRTTNGSGRITQFSFEQLRELDAGQGEKIPLLTEVIDLIDQRLPINIELKGPRVAEPVAKIINRYVKKKRWNKDLFIVSSFDHHQLRLFTALQPSIQVSALYDQPRIRLRRFLKNSRQYSANFDAALITNKNIQDAHLRGLKAYAYTVNSKREANRLRRMHIDGIFTNFPGKIS